MKNSILLLFVLLAFTSLNNAKAALDPVKKALVAVSECRPSQGLFEKKLHFYTKTYCVVDYTYRSVGASFATYKVKMEDEIFYMGNDADEMENCQMSRENAKVKAKQNRKIYGSYLTHFYATDFNTCVDSVKGR